MPSPVRAPAPRRCPRTSLAPPNPVRRSSSSATSVLDGPRAAAYSRVARMSPGCSFLAQAAAPTIAGWGGIRGEEEPACAVGSRRHRPVTGRRRRRRRVQALLCPGRRARPAASAWPRRPSLHPANGRGAQAATGASQASGRWRGRRAPSGLLAASTRTPGLRCTGPRARCGGRARDGCLCQGPPGAALALLDEVTCFATRDESRCSSVEARRGRGPRGRGPHRGRQARAQGRRDILMRRQACSPGSRWAMSAVRASDTTGVVMCLVPEARRARRRGAAPSARSSAEPSRVTAPPCATSLSPSFRWAGPHADPAHVPSGDDLRRKSPPSPPEVADALASGQPRPMSSATGRAHNEAGADGVRGGYRSSGAVPATVALNEGRAAGCALPDPARGARDGPPPVRPQGVEANPRCGDRVRRLGRDPPWRRRTIVRFPGVSCRHRGVQPRPCSGRVGSDGVVDTSFARARPHAGRGLACAGPKAILDATAHVRTSLSRWA